MKKCIISLLILQAIHACFDLYFRLIFRSQPDASLTINKKVKRYFSCLINAGIETKYIFA